MRLRIAQVVLSLEMGGLEVLVFQLAKALTEAGHDCVIFCLDAPGILAAEARKSGIEVVVLNRRQAIVDFSVLLELHKQFRQGGFNIVHTHNIEAMFYGAVAASFSKKTSVIHTQHGIPTPFGFKQRIRAKFSTLFIDRLIGVSKDVSSYLQRKHLGATRHQIGTVLNGIDTLRFKPDPDLKLQSREAMSISVSGFVLICVARLSEVKNHKRLLTIFNETRKEFPDTTLLLVGDGPMREEIKKTITDLDLGKQVRLLGEVLDVKSLLAAADVFVLASDSEGISVSILEAMSTGLVPVVTQVGGNSEIVSNGNNGYCIPKEDIEGFSASLVSLARDPDMREKFSSRARKSVENHFSLSSMVSSYQRIYQNASKD